MVADFETNYDESSNTAEVWSACFKEKGSDPEILREIDEFMRYLWHYPGRVRCFFHNLKFDGEFIVNWLASNKRMKQAYDEIEKKFKKPKELKSGEYTLLISKTGVWYQINWKTKRGLVTFVDSLKLAPMSLLEVGKSFQTEHQKLDMDFNEWMDSLKPLTEKQTAYIKNDVFVMEEFLEEFFSEGHNRMTVSSCALAEYKKILGKEDYEMFFPELKAEAWDFAEKCYHGGFVYVNPEFSGSVIKKHGKTIDVNSLYPYVMHSSSGNKYPVCSGRHWIGKKEKTNRDTMDFIHFKCSFKIRPGKLPFVHIRKNKDYPANQILETSWIWDYENEVWKTHKDGNEIICDFYMQDKELKLFLKHYHVWNFKIIEGWEYHVISGIFDDYINKFKEIKETTSGGKRTIAKLFMNGLYGKFATKRDSSFKIVDVEKTRETGITHFINVEENDKEVEYMPVGACVTSNALIYIVEKSQKFYEKGIYLYTDTDSIHYIDKDAPEIKIHPTELGAFKIETEWDEAIFLRAKTYVEKGDEYHIICAGMPKKCKDMLRISLGEDREKFEKLKLSKNEEEFTRKERTLSDFNVGLNIPGKLKPTHVIGGVALLTTEFTIKKGNHYGRVKGTRVL